jgi:hypothetical protein
VSNSSPLIRADAKERLEIYRVAVDMADRVSARRGTANAFFLTLNTALMGILGLGQLSTAPIEDGQASGNAFPTVVLAIVGITIAIAWFLLLRSYRLLNEAKFKIINDLESGLPFHPFGDEWKLLKRDPVKRWSPARYAELGLVEQIVPAAFAILYAVVGARAIL